MGIGKRDRTFGRLAFAVVEAEVDWIISVVGFEKFAIPLNGNAIDRPLALLLR